MSPLNRNRRGAGQGASTIEFMVAFVLVMLPLVLGTLELGQLAVARLALNYASFEAGRAGALTGGDRGAMREALARGMLPVLATFDHAAVARQGAADADPSSAIVARGLTRARLEMSRPDLVQWVVENPPQESFEDFAVLRDGVEVIPNEDLDRSDVPGPASGQTLADANVLAIRVRYCRELFMPFVGQWLAEALDHEGRSLFDRGCLARRRVPIEARAVLQMHSPLRRSAIDGG